MSLHQALQKTHFLYFTGGFISKLSNTANLVLCVCISFEYVKSAVILHGEELLETSYISVETALQYNIFKGKNLEEIKRGIAWAILLLKYIKRKARF